MLPWWLGMIVYPLVITVLIAILCNKYSYYDCFDAECGIGIFFTIVFLLLIASLIGAMYTDNNTDINYREIVEKNKEYIYSIEDNINISGSYNSCFIIGSGYIKENLYYYTLVGNDEGYILKKFKAEDIYLVPEDDIKPYYCEKYQVGDYNYPKNIIFGYIFKQWKPKCDKETLYKIELHLPKNYIKQNYNIDLK